MDGFRRPQTPQKRGERSPGGQKGHKGHTLKPVPNPDEIVVYKVSTCTQCEASLENVAPSAVNCRQAFDLPTLRLSMTEYCAECKWCPRSASVSIEPNFPLR
jgi:transposase